MSVCVLAHMCYMHSHAAHVGLQEMKYGMLFYAFLSEYAFARCAYDVAK